MGVVIKGSEPFDVMIASNIVNCQTANIKFKNISFRCETIEDADGTVFVKMPSVRPDVANINAGDTICRQAVFDVLHEECSTAVEDFLRDKVKQLPSAQPETCAYWDSESNFCALHRPSAQPEVKEIGYSECANAMLKMWIDNVLTDGEYFRIMDKLNKKWSKVNE